MSRLLQGLVPLGLGLWFVVISRRAAALAVRQWAQAYPNRRVSETAYRLASRIVGSIFILFGLLSLLGVLPSR